MVPTPRARLGDSSNKREEACLMMTYFYSGRKNSKEEVGGTEELLEVLVCVNCRLSHSSASRSMTFAS